MEKLTSQAYSGTDLLEVMAEAKIYNAYLTRLIAKNCTGHQLLDFGSGSGQFAKALRDKGFQVECVEPDLHLASELRKEGFVVYTALHEIAQKYDSIYSVNVLEHIADDQMAAEKLQTVLKPGGRMVIYVPAFQCLYSTVDAKIGHHRRYTKGTLAPLFQNLTTLQLRYVDSLGFFAALLYKWIGNKEGHVSPLMLRIFDRIVFPLSLCLDLFLKNFLGKNVFYVGKSKVHLDK